jgi:hypothetical protein
MADKMWEICSNPTCGQKVYVSVPKWKKSVTKVFYCDRRCSHEPSVDRLLKQKDLNSKNYREDLCISVRSSWEANIIRLLEYKKIPYYYEPTKFSIKVGEKTQYYVPDFIINYQVVEIKGSEQGRTYKPLLFSQQYNKKVHMIDYKVYKWLYKRYRNIIPHWEKSTEIEQLLSLGLL